MKEKAIWDKYIDEIVNKEAAEEQSYFWAVSQTKAIEGSAVVKGSNFYTPTISKAVKDTFNRTKRRADNSHSNNDQKKKKHLI
jgi:hypothetical protein